MNKYPKIPTMWRRRAEKPRYVIEGEWADPVIEYLSGLEWVGTEKVDGMNIRVIWDGKRVEFRGRTDKAQIPAALKKVLEETFCGKTDVFRELFGEHPACIYGEGFGGKIQKVGPLYGDVRFVAFDVWTDGYWWSYPAVEYVTAEFDIPIVPVVVRGTLSEIAEFVRRGFRSAFGDVQAEGVVARPAVLVYTRRGRPVTTKIKHSDFPH